MYLKEIVADQEDNEVTKDMVTAYRKEYKTAITK